MNNQQKKVALVTGGTSGIGLATAKAFAQKGFVVYAASRRGLKQPEQNGLNSLVMDVQSEESVAAAVARVVQEVGRIDVLVHCAGMGIAGAAEDTPISDAQRQLDVNYFGVLRVSRAVLPVMRAQRGGTCIVVGSVAGLIPIPFQSAYSASKYALEGYAQALRMESAAFGIKVCLIEPGDTKTGFTGARAFCIPQNSPYESACKTAVAVMEKDETGGVPPQKVTKAILRASLKKRPPVRIVVGLKYKLIVWLFRALPQRLALRILAGNYKVKQK